VPLSDNRVVTLLNRYYVPVYTSNEEFREGGSAPPEERAELLRIHREGREKQLSVGSVHAYVLSPDGRTLDSLHVAEAFKPERLATMLERQARALGVRAGEPVLKPAPQSAAQPQPGALLLHLTARYLERRGEEYTLVTGAGGNWSALPGEDWLSLDREQWTKLFPPGKPAVGHSWEVDREVAAALLNRFYPPTENNDLRKNRIDRQSFRGTVTALKDGVALARLEGSFKMKHPFYHKDDNNFAEGRFVGYVEWDVRGAEIRSFRLVTEDAKYGPEGEAGQPFGVAVRSLPLTRGTDSRTMRPRSRKGAMGVDRGDLRLG
jgi:hypothetical protein